MPEGVGYGPQNTASIGLDIHVIGNHAYALSGMFGASTSEQTLLDFTSGNYYLVGRVTFTGSVKSTAPQSGSISAAVVSFNGIPIAILKNDGLNEPGQYVSYSKIIIPPFTNVKVTVESADTDSDNEGSALITGIIYK
jgi:hypothetical protein